MNIVKSNYFFAAVADYNCGTYGGGNYNTGDCMGTNPGAQPGGLADTGYDVLLPIFLGISLLAAGAILVIRRVLRKRKATHTA